MSEFNQIVLLLTFYRIVTVLIGLAFAVLGYKLFCRGVYDKAGELKAAWGDRHLVLKQAAPGTIFALFGVVVIAIGLWRGIEIDVEKARTAAPPTAQEVPPYDLRWRDIFGKRLSRETVAIIEKAIEGKTLEQNEREILNQWLEMERIRIRAYDPDPPKVLPWDAPAPAPG